MNFAGRIINDMDTIIINVEEWKELLLKIDWITAFVEQFMERLPVADNAWLNDKEACNCLQISPRTLQRLRKNGDISFSTVAKKHFYKASEIRELMERKSVKSSREQLEALRNSHRTRFLSKK